MKKCYLFTLLLLGCTSAAVHAEPCGWLPASKVDATFPEFAPFQTMVGGKIGMCKFVGNGGSGMVIFGANQTVESSAAEAEDTVKTIKEASADDYVIQAAPTLGKLGFTYAPKADQPPGRSLFFAGHHGKVVVIGSAVMAKAITPAQRGAILSLAQAALAVADDPRAVAAASQCPYFDEATIKRLLPGKDFNENVYGSNSCMAQASGKAVIVSVIADADADQVAANMSSMTDGGCSSEPQPQLGTAGKLLYGCKGGAPHATVRFVAHGKLFEYSFAPERAPTPAERALLVELAQKGVH